MGTIQYGNSLEPTGTCDAYLATFYSKEGIGELAIVRGSAATI